MILANAGDFPWETEAEELAQAGATVLSGVAWSTWRGCARSVTSIESMDLGFALQARCLEAVATRSVGTEACVVPAPRVIDEQVASQFVAAF